MTEQNLGWPGLIYYSSVEKLVRCEDLVGKQFLACSGENEKLVVSCRDGSYLINLNNTSQLFWQDSFLQVSAGKNFLVGIGLNNSLYSWGVDGDHGQLGQGASVKKIFEPLEVPFKANFQDVSCGEAFSVAVDDKGFAYAWGENFDRQLGIYTKTKEKMHIPNAVIEEVIFNPRIIPLSMKIPMQKVVCGSRFVLALTQGGKLFSWGAGESGQLGTGRCTRRDIPEEVNLPDNVSYSVKDIACGNGHALAIVDNGAIYSWGLNHRGQCGLGDIKARHFPVLITPSSPRSSNNRITYRKVIADGHSSAAIDDQGKLWTWGSITYGRLLHTLPDEPLPNPDGMKEKIDMTIRQPKLVVSDVITTQTRIEQFVFSRERSAILVKTTVTDISPKKGPKRTFSKLTIHGYGFWESPQIIIKFTANSYSIYNPPRSCLGKFVSSNQLTCKPPKFAEIGMYTVTVSMDGGKEFLPQSYEVLIYKDMTLISQSPSIIDLREKFIPTLTLKANALKVDVQDLNQVYVKLLFYSINDINDVAAAVHPKKSSSVETKTIVAEIVVTGDLTPLESNSSELPPPPTDPEVATYTDQSTANSQTNRTATSDEVLLQIQCKDIDLSKYSAITSSFNLYELQCSISMNAQDFAVIKDSSSKTEKAEAKEPGGAAVTGGAAVAGGADQGGAASTSSICHSFTPKTALPNYYSLTNLLTLKDVTEQDEKEDAEKNVNINEFNPFNPEGNLLLQQREEKYHQFDKKIVLQGESFFLTNKLPKGSHIKVITHQIQLIPLLYQHHKGSSNPQGGEVQILTITKEEIQEQLQELLIHCETKTQAHFTLNYHYLMELSRFLSSYLTTHTEGSSLTLQDFKIELQFQFYLELASSHSSHYYHQQQQQFNLPPLPLSTVSGGPAGSTDSYTSEKLLLSPDFVAVTIMKDMQILLSPALMKKFPKLIEGEEEASPTSLIKITPKELLAFPFQSSIFNIALQIPKLILDPTNTNQQYDIPPYLLSKEAISSQSLTNGETETLSEQLIPLASEYFSVATTIPSYQMILDYAYRYVSNFPSSSTLTLTSSNELQSFLKTVTLAIYYETPSPSTQPVMSAPIYYYNSLHQYSLQNPLPKGGAVKETTVSLVLEEYLPVAIASASMTACVRIRGQDASKELILPANMTEITNAAGVQQTVISFTISEPPKVIELGAVMNGKEKTFYVDIGLKPIRSSEGEGGSIAVFDNAVSPILVMKQQRQQI